MTGLLNADALFPDINTWDFPIPIRAANPIAIGGIGYQAVN
jgi:hypothetical protein